MSKGLVDPTIKELIQGQTKIETQLSSFEKQTYRNFAIQAGQIKDIPSKMATLIADCQKRRNGKCSASVQSPSSAPEGISSEDWKILKAAKVVINIWGWMPDHMKSAITMGALFGLYKGIVWYFKL